jgi:hypothetical protein
MPIRSHMVRLLCAAAWLSLLLSGCVHRIHVEPTPAVVASRSLPLDVTVDVPFLALEGADHMPGIVMLEWPREDLRDGIISYIQKRGTFSSVGTQDGGMVLTVKAWLALRAPDHYVYHVHLEADVGKPDEPPVASYVASAQATGSAVRWVTASDRDPIQAATTQALDSLLSQIEADYAKLRQSRSPDDSADERPTPRTA